MGNDERGIRNKARKGSEQKVGMQLSLVTALALKTAGTMMERQIQCLTRHAAMALMVWGGHSAAPHSLAPAADLSRFVLRAPE